MLFLIIVVDLDVAVKNMCSVLSWKWNKGFHLHLGRATKCLVLLLKIIRVKCNVCACVRARALILALVICHANSVFSVSSYIVISDMFGSTIFFHIMS